MIARKLSIVNINDDISALLCAGPDRGEKYKRYFDLLEVTCIQDVQNCINDPLSMSAPDLFLYDINMIQSEDQSGGFPSHLNWLGTTKGSVVPFGPILALPFMMGRRAASFVPYSNYWQDEALMRDGLFSVALALLFSRAKNRPVAIHDIPNEVDSAVRGINDARSALENALDLFRRRLTKLAGGDGEKDKQKIEFVDIGTTMDRIAEFEEGVLDLIPVEEYDGVECIRRPTLEDEDGSLAITYIDKDYEDCIRLDSIFFDVLGAKMPGNLIEKETFRNSIDAIWQQLEHWRGMQSLELSGNRRATAEYSQGKSLYDCIVDTLKSDGNLKAAAVATDFVRRHDENSKYLVLRLAMEFAWIHAWFRALTQEHRALLSERDSMVRFVYETLRLSGKNPTEMYQRLLAKSRNGRNYVDGDDKWRRSFWHRNSGLAGRNDYHLISKERPAMLSYLERKLCIQYAQTELRWDPINAKLSSKNPPYPQWMIEAEKAGESTP